MRHRAVPFLVLSLALAAAGCSGRRAPSAVAPSPSSGELRPSCSALPERVRTPSEVTVLDLGEEATSPADAAGPRRFDALGHDASGALLAWVARGAGKPCQAARIDGRGAVVVTPTCPETRYDAWPSPDGALLAHMEYVGRGVMMAPSWRLFVQADDGSGRSFVSHGGPFPGSRPLVKWSGTGHHLLLAAGSALFFDADTRRAWSRPSGGVVEAAAIDTDGLRAALGIVDGDVTVVSRESPEEPRVVGHIDGHVGAVAIHGARVAAAARSGQVTVWDVASREAVATLEVWGPVQELAWSDDGRVLAALSRGALWLVHPGADAAVRLRPVVASSALTLVASDRRGHVEAPPDALALLRWRASLGAGETRLLDVGAEERELGASPVESGLLARLFVSDP